MYTGITTQKQGSILKELLRTPVFKDILRTNLNSMSPTTGRYLIKTLMEQDPEVFLAIVSSLPVFLNNLSNTAAELATRLSKQFPPELLISYLESLFEDMDTTKGTKACRELFASLWGSSPDLRDRARKAILVSGPKVISEGINFLACTVNSTVKKDPQSLSTFVSGILHGLDHEEVRQATQGLAEAMLDQKWLLLSWMWQLAKSRIRKRLKAFG